MNASGPERRMPWLAPLQARIRVRPEDFQVEELPATEPDGQGEHVWLEIEKRLLNSEDVAVQLGRLAQVGRAAVSYAGRKDRHAVTRQWFSVQCPPASEPDWEQLPALCAGEDPGARVQVLQVRRHSRKLKTGHLAGNRFVLWLREVEGDLQQAMAVLESIRERGVPNYFGAQRFGHTNLERARAWLEAGGRPPRGRNQRSLLLSAARAAIFNAVLAERVRQNAWDVLWPGDVAGLEGSNSVFAVEAVDADLQARLARRDIHPTGPLWGSGGLCPSGAAGELEQMAMAPFEGLARGLEREKLRAARRSLRLCPAAMDWDQEDAQTLVLRLSLNAGEYATSVLETLLGSGPEGTAAPRF